MKTQKKSCKWTDSFLEWIPFENFQNLKKIGDGHFSTVYCATWMDGKRIKSTNKSVCARSAPITVALKSIKNSANISEKYVQELENYYKCTLVKSKKRKSYFLEIYGMTFNVKTDEYMFVTQYSEFGNLRDFIKENKFSNISWSQKLWWLCDITSTLTNIHKEGLVHGNLHPGNILQIGEDVRDTHSTIADVGLSLPAYSFYGVLPYIAPEVLKGNKYTKRSDLYSLGILMMELATGEPPFYERPHDQSLIKEICENHKRPNLLESTPSKFKDLALHCTDPNPYARPPARLLSYIFSNWWQVVEQSQDYEIRHQFNSSDKFIKNMEDVKLDHDFNAIYTSRYFNFNNDDDYSSIDKNNEMFHADINNNLESKYLLDLSVSP
ncbi:5124_t:CDS:2 [Entrophospora sp. SA101]|nr:5124_t:CDS:2 [Entrophospora sp. SA101]